jgi:flagellar hook-basal body complex protein FliE
MNIGSIDSSRIEAMIAQLKAQATRPSGAADGPEAVQGAPKVDFAAALKNSIEQVSDAQLAAGAKGRAFSMGDETVSLSEVMIDMQKAGIAFQATLQVRNKLVSAYHEIMSMQV